MSVLGISSSNALQTSFAQGAQNKFQQIQSQFQKVGQDLQSGNLSQARADFATLTQELPSSLQSAGSTTGSTTGSTSAPANTIAQAFQTLGNDLQSGNLSAAQQEFAAIQQAAQQNSAQAQGVRHHHHGGGGSQPTNTLQQDFGTLGQALQSGSLSSAQQAYASLQSDLQQALPNFSAGSGAGDSPTSTTGGVSVTA